MSVSILLLHNRISCEDNAHDESRSGVLAEVEAVSLAASKLGFRVRVEAVSRLQEVADVLQSAQEKIVFNLVEELEDGAEDYNFVPALCKTFGKAVTGNSTAALLLTWDKFRTKAVLSELGVKVPAGRVIRTGQSCLSSLAGLEGPLIVKPLATDASEGISGVCVFSGVCEGVVKAVKEIHRSFNMPALVEQYVGSREFNVSVFQRGGNIEVLPPAEIVFVDYPPDRPRVVDYAAKWKEDSFEYQNTRRVVPATIDKKLAGMMKEIARVSWEGTGCAGYARVDFRMTDDGELYVLEVNCNPDIAPDAGFSAALAAAGISYEDFVFAVINAAKPTEHVPKKNTEALFDSAEAIRRTVATDRDKILAFIVGTGFFRPGEVETAREVLDDALRGRDGGHYQSFTFVEQGEPAGWICFGETPCTVGTFDIYWIVVDPSHQRLGIGRKLMSFAEARMIECGGRLSVIETSGAGLYEQTVAFYRKQGYEEQAKLTDFYDTGDPKLIFVKRLE